MTFTKIPNNFQYSYVKTHNLHIVEFFVTAKDICLNAEKWGKVQKS